MPDRRYLVTTLRLPFHTNTSVDMLIKVPYAIATTMKSKRPVSCVWNTPEIGRLDFSGRCGCRVTSPTIPAFILQYSG